MYINVYIIFIKTGMHLGLCGGLILFLYVCILILPCESSHLKVTILNCWAYRDGIQSKIHYLFLHTK